MRVDTADARPALAAACMPGRQVLKRTREAEEGDSPPHSSVWGRFFVATALSAVAGHDPGTALRAQRFGAVDCAQFSGSRN